MSISEKEFQAQVIEYAHHLGYRVAHFRSVRVARRDGSVYYQTPTAADGAGFPDLCLVRGDRSLFAELKTDVGRLSPAQQVWLDLLRAAGQEVHVWRPRDWSDIEKSLA